MVTFWMFLSKEKNSVKVDRFLLWDNVVSMYTKNIVDMQVSENRIH